ncbi:hypothetical protein WJX75_006241 [Coccomyxa subellipsoidea]|uniref:FHA domain-containing protein n=1 Tax=Coccomyxa subellipsoidea TaxID=248742 RepID=A0ABR2Z1Y1_9CHLO
MTEGLAQPLEAAHEYGKLVFLDKDGERAQQYPINKNLVVLGRDKACDIVITRREVSRHHAQLAVDDAGAVWLSSLGREPVSVNGKPATEAVELFTGDQIEIFLEGRVKILCFEAEDATIKINKGGPTPRKPLGDASQNTGALVPAAAAVKPSPASASRGRRTPAKRAAGTAGPAPPPPAPPLPPRGSLLPGYKPAGAASKIPKLPPLPKPADLRNGLKKGAAEEPDHQAGQAATKTEAPQKMAVPSAPGTFLPSANELLALRAGLRKTGAAPPLEASESAVAPPAADGRDATAKKRKSVRFNIPAKEPRSPEGVPTDATVALDFGSPSSPDVIINVNADSTAAFSAWAMGSSGLSGNGRRSLGDTLTGGLPSILEEAPEDCAASPPPAMQVTPSREITPMLCRRSGRTSSITCSSPDSVGRKRRSCSGSRNGTPASKGAAPINADPEMAAAAAEEAALDASLAAAEAAAAGTGHILEGDTVATLAAAAAQLQAAAEEAVKEGTPCADQQLPAGEAVKGTPSAGAPRMERLDSPATPWVPQIGVEAAAIAAALAASRSATPASAPGSPAAARATPGRRGRSSASSRKSRMSLAALAAPPEDSPSAKASAADVTEVLTQQFSAAKTGTKAPINTPVDVTGMPSFAALDMEGAQALEAQLAEATALAVRLQQTNQELSARLQMLEQRAVAVQAPSIENETQAMDTDNPALDAAAPMEEENAPMTPVTSAAPAVVAGSALGSASVAGGRHSIAGAMAQLPFEGLSQALSQGSLEWVDGLILPGGSQEAAAAGAGTPAHVPAPAEATAAPPTDVLAQGQDAVAPTEQVAEMSLTSEDLTAEQAPVQDVQPAATPHEAPSADVDGARAEEPVTDEVAALPKAAEAKEGSSKTSEEAAVKAAEAEAEEEEEEDTCHVCGEADEGDVLLLCDGCDNACHLGCARPMLRRVPKNDWFCSECKVARGAASRAAKRKAQTAEAKADAEEPQKPSKNPRRSEPEQGAAAGDAKDAGTDDRSLAPEEAPARSGRSTRRSLVAVQPAQEAVPRPARGRRTSLAVAADNNPRKETQASIVVPEAEAPGSAVTQARTTRRRASLAQTPATMQLAEAAAAPRTAASTRGARRKSVSPALDAAPMQEATALRSLGPAKRMTLASVEASLGPALGSLGVIEEADEEMGSDADEGESAPAAVPKKAPAPARAARGRKALEDKTNQEAPQPPARRIRAAAAGPASKQPRAAASPPKTRRSTRSRC